MKAAILSLMRLHISQTLTFKKRLQAAIDRAASVYFSCHTET